MNRPDRWWRPRTTRRPGQRARARRMYSGEQLDATFETGVEVGKVEERKRHERLTDGLQRLNDAIRAQQDGDPRPLEELGRQAAADDLMDLADAAGVAGGGVGETDTPGEGVISGDALAGEIERWLREQD